MSYLREAFRWAGRTRLVSGSAHRRPRGRDTVASSYPSSGIVARVKDSAPEIDPAPDISREALQALRGDFLYFQVAGSGPTFPVAHRAADSYRSWLSSVGMFSHVGYDAYNLTLDQTRADFAAAIGDDGGATRIALAQSATDGLNTLVAGLRLEPNALVVTTAEEHGSALLPVFGRRARGDRVRVDPACDRRKASSTTCTARSRKGPRRS